VHRQEAGITILQDDLSEGAVRLGVLSLVIEVGVRQWIQRRFLKEQVGLDSEYRDRPLRSR